MTGTDSLFSARVGRSGRQVHLAAEWDRKPFIRTACGYFGHAGYITRCDLEPVTCKACLRKTSSKLAAILDHSDV